MTKKQRNNLIRIITAAVLLLALHFVELDRPVMFLLYLVPYLIVGYDILKKAGKGIINRQPLLLFLFAHWQFSSLFPFIRLPCRSSFGSFLLSCSARSIMRRTPGCVSALPGTAF